MKTLCAAWECGSGCRHIVSTNWTHGETPDCSHLHCLRPWVKHCPLTSFSTHVGCSQTRGCWGTGAWGILERRLALRGEPQIQLVPDSSFWEGINSKMQMCMYRTVRILSQESGHCHENLLGFINGASCRTSTLTPVWVIVKTLGWADPKYLHSKYLTLELIFNSLWINASFPL